MGLKATERGKDCPYDLWYYFTPHVDQENPLWIC